MNRNVLAIGGGALVLLGLAIYARLSKGGIGTAAASAGSALGGAVVDAAGGAASGAVGAVGSAVGLPTPAETTTDEAVARWIVDNYGWFEASKWSGAPALARAAFMAEGSGKPPPAGSAAAIALPAKQNPIGLPMPGDYSTAPVPQVDGQVQEGPGWWGWGP